MLEVIRWEEPSSTLETEAQQLRNVLSERPGEWALVAEHVYWGIAHHITGALEEVGLIWRARDTLGHIEQSIYAKLPKKGDS